MNPVHEDIPLTLRAFIYALSRMVEAFEKGCTIRMGVKVNGDTVWEREIKVKGRI